MALLFIVPFTDKLNESTVIVLSGLWALGPDLNKFIGAADALNGTMGNIFWFHPLIDSMETGYPNIEMFVSLVILLTTVVLIEKRGNL